MVTADEVVHQLARGVRMYLTMHLDAMLVLVDLYVHLLEQTRRRQGLHRARIDRDVAQGRRAARHAGQRTPRQVDMVGRPQDEDALDALRVKRLVRAGCRRATVAVPGVGRDDRTDVANAVVAGRGVGQPL